MFVPAFFFGYCGTFIVVATLAITGHSGSRNIPAGHLLVGGAGLFALIYLGFTTAMLITRTWAKHEAKRCFGYAMLPVAFMALLYAPIHMILTGGWIVGIILAVLSYALALVAFMISPYSPV